MISVNNIDRIKNLLSQMFFYGLTYHYSYEYIEERVCSSSFVEMLEKYNDDSFIYSSGAYKATMEIFSLKSEQLLAESINSTNALCLWLGEAYTRLFFKFHKSFSFIFLYFPLELAIDSYDVYHEMDYVELYNLFNELINKETIIDLLLKKKEMSYEQLSILTNIKKNTLLNYSRSNKNIYLSSYSNLFKISKVLKVNINIFVENILNYPVESMYQYNKEDKNYRNKLGLLYARYYIKEIRNINYEYDEKMELYKSDTSYFKVIWTNYKKGRGLIFTSQNDSIRKVVEEYLKNNKVELNKLNLVVFEFDGLSSSIDYYKSLKDYGLNNVFIINEECLLQIGKNKSKTFLMRDDVNEYLMQEARMG